MFLQRQGHNQRMSPVKTTLLYERNNRTHTHTHTQAHKSKTKRQATKRHVFILSGSQKCIQKYKSKENSAINSPATTQIKALRGWGVGLVLRNYRT